jgi:hypothetical protein
MYCVIRQVAETLTCKVMLSSNCLLPVMHMAAAARNLHNMAVVHAMLVQLAYCLQGSRTLLPCMERLSLLLPCWLNKDGAL